MFERFTERSRQVVVLAQDEARRLKHGYIGTEHILLGLLREEEGVAARLLTARGIRLDDVRLVVESTIGVGENGTTGQIPFTPRAKRALELSLREALTLGHNYIGTEHLLLGLVREDGRAARILAGYSMDPELVRNEVIECLSGRSGSTQDFVATQIVLDDVNEWTGYAPEPAAASERDGPLILAIVLAAASFPLGLAVGWLIWG